MQDLEDAGPEADDYLHEPDAKTYSRGTIFTARGLMNLGCITTLVSALLMLFAGYPIIVATRPSTSTTAGFNLGGVNSSGQVPATVGNFGLIDEDTPTDAYTITSNEGTTWELQFSDEFETEGRSFYPGDDPYWEAGDFHAWATTDLEWYSPKAFATVNGSLEVSLSQESYNGLDYVGGSLTSWNKLCFTGGRLEVRVQLPGRPDVWGLWPAVWTMGNLGRVGYGGTLDGMWPYSYDSCDVGTVSNQSLAGVPAIASTGNKWGTELSFLPGQRLSRCTCTDDETHPGPKHTDGTWVGRSAPEIDLFEAQVDNSLALGQVSQCSRSHPPSPSRYYLFDNVTNAEIYNASVSALNSYSGGQYQQSTSVLSTTNQECYQYTGADNLPGCFSVYAFEYAPGDDGYIQWHNDDKPAWKYLAAGMAANTEAEVGNRPVPQEPMYILFNLAISLAFGAIDYDGMEGLWPMKMLIDYVRLYQDPAKRNIGCDPDDFPTADYIARYPDGYSNVNITTWDQVSLVSSLYPPPLSSFR
ncbi:glycoside hydrolase family 16 protein [Mrakia frigida]|uniref:glycoside hydrolase family 16 protein n=1 Tax=Mrakia frigida TaxID=29902 RepID=UPI003FCC0B9C